MYYSLPLQQGTRTHPWGPNLGTRSLVGSVPGHLVIHG